MSPARVASIASLYVAVFGALLTAWLGTRAADSAASAGALAAGGALVSALVLGSHRGERSQLMAKLTALVAMLPILMLFWAVDVASSARVAAPSKAAPAVVAAAAIDANRLFEGAILRSNSGGVGGTVREVHAAAFADASEIRLMQFNSDGAASDYLAALQAPEMRAEPDPRRQGLWFAESPGGVAYAERHGGDVIQITAANRDAIVARLTAAALGPGDALAKVSDKLPVAVDPPPVWPYAIGFGALHALGFVGLVVWASVATTLVAALPATRKVDSESLARRLLSLGHTALPCAVSQGSLADSILIEYRYPPGVARRHSFDIELRPGRARAYVVERAGASGAAPRDESEADMRPLGSVGIDPTRPRASRIFGHQRLATIVDGSRLDAVPLKLSADAVSLPDNYAAAVTDEAMAYVVAAVVTRSGWSFQPVLFAFQKR